MTVFEAQLDKEARDRYLTYALSVVSGRALPDVRDGLKPVQRRILFAMLHNLGLGPDKSHRKSAAVVGEVLARFHPHGDAACYEALVRMAQDFSLRYPLIDGQGNFGSLDGDAAAAYRYTEAKLRAIAIDVIGEIDQETVDFRENFDSTTHEPIVFPCRVPHLLINGASGIAVGMATSIPPHNLRDTVKAILELAEEPEISEARLANIIKGPDFPTGCQILNTQKELTEIYRTGRGSVRMRSEWKEEEGNRGKRNIIVTSIPYAVNKSDLVTSIAELIIERKVPQLNDVRDESTDEIRIVLELTSGASAEAAMAYLFKHTNLEGNFPVNLTALVPTAGASCRPEVLSLKSCLQHFLKFRQEVTQKRLIFERKNLLARIHILEGLSIIYDALDVALKIVRQSEGRTDAATKLRERFKLSEIQAFAVVDMRIYQLSRTNIEEIKAELAQKERRVKEINSILASPAKMLAIVKKDLEEVAEKYGDRRRSSLAKDGAELEYNEEAYVVREDVFAIISADGWIKRIRQNNEVSATRIREGDYILQAHAVNTLDSIVILTSHGSCYVLKVTDFPASGGYGDPIQKLLKFKDGEKIVTTYALRAAQAVQELPLGLNKFDIKEGESVVLISKSGVGFALKLEGLEGLKRSGKRAMKLRDGDELAAVTRLHKKIAMFTASGSGLVIESKELPLKDSAVIGVALMGVRDGDKLVAAVSYDRDCKLKLKLDGGKIKEIDSKELVHGHRALKGNKVGVRDEILAVELA